VTAYLYWLRILIQKAVGSLGTSGPKVYVQARNPRILTFILLIPRKYK
jgi:hypothetical protein